MPLLVASPAELPPGAPAPVPALPVLDDFGEEAVPVPGPPVGFIVAGPPVVVLFFFIIIFLEPISSLVIFFFIFFFALRSCAVDAVAVLTPDFRAACPPQAEAAVAVPARSMVARASIWVVRME